MLRHLAFGLVVLEACTSPEGPRSTSAPLGSPASLAASRVVPPATEPGAPIDVRSLGAIEAEPGESVIYEDGHFVAAPRIRDAVGDGLAKRVLGATFSRYLTTECPKIPGVEHATGWVELDRMQSEASALGLFRPKIVQRVDGHFTAPYLDETLFTIDIGNCVNNAAYQVMHVVFDTSKVETPNTQLRARVRVETHHWGGIRFVGVVERDGLDVLIATTDGYSHYADAQLRRFLPGTERVASWQLVTDEHSVLFDAKCSVVLTAPSAPLKLRKAHCLQ